MSHSTSVINVLYGFFGHKKDKLIWTGTLEDLKAFVLTEIDEETAKTTTWRSPSGGKWCFGSQDLKVTWYTKSQTICFEGNKADDLCKRINEALLQSTVANKAGDGDLSKSLECFITELADIEGDVSSDEAAGLYTSVLQVSNISCCNNSDIHVTSDKSTSEMKSTAIISAAENSKPCCTCCLKNREDIDKLNAEIAALKNKDVFLEREALANSNLIINLQRDNSSLIKTVEMLSEQLLNLNTSKGKDKNCLNSSKAMAYSTTKVHKENKRKIKKKGKGQGNEVSSDNSPASNAPRDASLPRDNTPLPRHVSLPREPLSAQSNRAGGKAIPSNTAENKSSNKNKKKNVVVIAGDSLVKNMVGAYMGKDDADNYYVVKPFPGATVEDMEDFIKPITRKSPDKLILHIGTNDLRNCEPKIIADSIVNLITQIKEDSPNTTVGISALLERKDCPKLATKVKQVNLILDNYCQLNKIPFLKNANININHLNSRGLHLSKLGTQSLQNNFIEFANNLD